MPRMFTKAGAEPAVLEALDTVVTTVVVLLKVSKGRVIFVLS